MRRTLSIDDDVLATTKGIAVHENENKGEVIPELTRQTLLPRSLHGRATKRNGVLLLALQAGTLPVTAELVNQFRDELA